LRRPEPRSSRRASCKAPPINSSSRPRLFDLAKSNPRYRRLPCVRTTPRVVVGVVLLSIVKGTHRGSLMALETVAPGQDRDFFKVTVVELLGGTLSPPVVPARCQRLTLLAGGSHLAGVAAPTTRQRGRSCPAPL
jgi:hypothetical protein